MVHQIFDTATVGYDDFVSMGGKGFSEGVGGLMETGGENSYNVYRGGSLFQRGYGHQGGNGVGSVLHGMWRFFLPIIRKVGTAVSSEALNTGQRILEKVTKEGQPLKSAILNEGKSGIDTLLEQGGLPKQFGTGRKGIKRKRQNPSFLPDTQTLIGRAITKPILNSRKRVRSDAFGLY